MAGRRTPSASTARTRWRVSLVMPAWNEADAIVQSITEAHEALSDLDYQFELIVVDDGSTDRTAELVQDLLPTCPALRLVRHATNRGYGAALRTGFEQARYECVAFTDADAQFYLEDLDRLMPLTVDYPIVVGYREDRQDPWQRKFFSWGYNRLVRTLLGTQVRDCDCALKVFRREVLFAILPRTNGFFVNAEMLCRANRYDLPIAEVGVRHRERRQGSSKVSLWDIPKTLRKLIPFWISEVLLRRRPDPLLWPLPGITPNPLPASSRSRSNRSRISFRPRQPR